MFMETNWSKADWQELQELPVSEHRAAPSPAMLHTSFLHSHFKQENIPKEGALPRAKDYRV